MPRYLVELYAPGTAPLVDVARPALALAAGAASVRYLWSIFVPEDEICMHVFDAASPVALRIAARHAGLELPRVVEAFWLGAGEGQEAAAVPAAEETATGRAPP